MIPDNAAEAANAAVHRIPVSLRPTAALLEAMPAPFDPLAEIEAWEDESFWERACLALCGEVVEEPDVPALPPLTHAGATRLTALGVPPLTVARLMALGDIGAAKVAVTGGRFEFDGDDESLRPTGRPCGPAALPLLEGTRLLLVVREAGFAPVDLVAIDPARPDGWALWRGAEELLGGWTLDRATTFGEASVRLHATPLDWLRAGCTGVCVLEWNHAARARLRALGSAVTIVADPALARRVRAELERGDLPRVAESAEADAGAGPKKKAGKAQNRTANKSKIDAWLRGGV